jgi:hypothetical protein
MAKEALYPIAGSGVVFRETFNSASGLARNGGNAADLSFSNGKATLNGSTSYINYRNELYGTYSVRFVIKKDSLSSTSYVLDTRGSDGNGVGYVIIESSTGQFTISAGTTYVNGTAANSITAGEFVEVVVAGITLETGTGTNKLLLGTRLNFQSFFDGEFDLVEIYDRTLTSEEISNLYNKKHYAGLVTDNLVGYWDLTQQSAYDYSGNGNNGTLTPGTGGYKKGHGLEFDGSATRIEIPASSDFNIGANDFSICATLKTNINTLTKIIFARWGSSTTREFSFQTTNIGVLYFYCSDDGTNLINFQSYPNKILTDTWYFVCFTKTGLTGKLYRAGMYDKSGIEEISRLGGVFSSLYFNTNSVTEIGTRQRVIGEWDGNMKQLAFYNGKALSAEEIAQNYQYAKTHFVL